MVEELRFDVSVSSFARWHTRDDQKVELGYDWLIVPHVSIMFEIGVYVRCTVRLRGIMSLTSSKYDSSHYFASICRFICRFGYG